MQYKNLILNRLLSLFINKNDFKCLQTKKLLKKLKENAGKAQGKPFILANPLE